MSQDSINLLNLGFWMVMVMCIGFILTQLRKQYISLLAAIGYLVSIIISYIYYRTFLLSIDQNMHFITIEQSNHIMISGLFWALSVLFAFIAIYGLRCKSRDA